MKKISYRLHDDEFERLQSLYKFLDISADNEVAKFRTLLDFMFSFHVLKQNELEPLDQTLVELPSCPNRPSLLSKGINRGKVYCSSPRTVGLRSGNIVELIVCQNCWARQLDEYEETGEPIPNQELAPRYKPESDRKQTEKTTTPEKTVQVKKEREYQVCQNPACDVKCFKGDKKEWPDWTPDLCSTCYSWRIVLTQRARTWIPTKDHPSYDLVMGMLDYLTKKGEIRMEDRDSKSYSNT